MWPREPTNYIFNSSVSHLKNVPLWSSASKIVYPWLRECERALYIG